MLDPDFLDKILLPVVEAVAPFVQLLNEVRRRLSADDRAPSPSSFG